jgi:N-methylhydantoinase A/oxoprolinase/acetone carboxylase beta subunit
MELKLSTALHGRSEVEWARTADLRFGGQSWEVEVGFPSGTIDAGVLAALRTRFEDEHERLYGVKDQAGSPVEIRALRLVALGEAATTGSFHRVGANAASSAGSSRRIQIDGAGVDAPVRTRSSLADAPEPGPLLVDEYDTTVVVLPGWSARRHAATGTLVLERGDGH